MASHDMHERLNVAWQYAHARSRRYVRGSTSPLPVTPEAQAEMDRISEVQRYAERHTDRQTAAAYPDVVERAVTAATWARIRPEGRE